jgi:hypothetical protein
MVSLSFHFSYSRLEKRMRGNWKVLRVDKVEITRDGTSLSLSVGNAGDSASFAMVNIGDQPAPRIGDSFVLAPAYEICDTEEFSYVVAENTKLREAAAAK